MKIKWVHPTEAPYYGLVSFDHLQVQEVDNGLARQLCNRFAKPNRVPDLDLIPPDFNSRVGWFEEIVEEEKEEDDRCEAIAEWTGERCKKPKVDGAKYCSTHLEQDNVTDYEV